MNTGRYKVRIVSVFGFFLAGFSGTVYSFPVMDIKEYDSDSEAFEYNSINVLHVFSRHKRSTNGTQTTDNRSAIQRFYDDPNNKAMFLVFPIFVLIICTCCGFYFCDKVKKHFKKKKAEQRKRENVENQNKPSTLSSIEEDPSETSTSVSNKEKNKFPYEDSANTLKREASKISNTASISCEDKSDILNKKSEEMHSLRSHQNDTPLEDIENSPEVRAVNAVPIKHRETSFMTDVKNANTYNVDVSSNIDVQSQIISTDDVRNTSSASDISTESVSKSEPDINSNIVIRNTSNSRPNSKQSAKLNNMEQGLVQRDIEKQSLADKIKKPSSEDTSSAKSILTPDVIKPQKNVVEPQSSKPRRRMSLNSISTVPTSNRTVSPDTNSYRTVSVHNGTQSDITKDNKFPKFKQKFTNLSPEAIGEILQYYKDKKHMPDIIPDESENLVPLKKRFKKTKYKVFNG